MSLFKKKCQYCGIKIEKGKEIFEEVKVPEFIGVRLRPFCCKEHVKLYKKNITGIPSSNSCPFCKT